MNPAPHEARREPEAPMRAPTIVSAGVEWGRERVVALADAHTLPARATLDVFALLSACDVDDELDPRSLSVVAEVIAWLDGNGKVIHAGSTAQVEVAGDLALLVAVSIRADSAITVSVEATEGG